VGGHDAAYPTLDRCPVTCRVQGHSEPPTDVLRYLLRELLALRHDWARLRQPPGGPRDAITRTLDEVAVGMETEIKVLEERAGGGVQDR